MKRTFTILAAAMALSVSSAFAGLTVNSTTSSISSFNTRVSCNGSMPIPVILQTNLSWSLVNILFLQKTKAGHCVFTNRGGQTIGSSDVLLSSDLKIGTLSNITHNPNYSVTVTGNDGPGVTVTLGLAN